MKIRLQKNWKSGITVGLVSIPLSISLAVASQTTPIAGILTAIWAGLIASIFGGSNFNIIGPTGALSGILASYALIHGAQSLPFLAIVTGIIILIAYSMHLEKYLVFIPGSTIHGFTLGVACIIALNQLNFALGISGLPVHEKFLDNIMESLLHVHALSIPTCILFALFLMALILWSFFISLLPGVIILAPIGIIIGYLASHGILPFTFETLEQRFGHITFTPFLVPTIAYNNALITTAIMVALIAILETLISARIADGMTKTHHNTRKELFGLGLANIASGIMGGIPATAALARTALNVKSDATSKFSALLCSITVAIICAVFLNFFSYIPLAVIAAILVYTALRMIEAEHFIRLFHVDKSNFTVSIIVALITIYQDPIIGILAGIALALVIFMKHLSQGYFETHTHHDKSITSSANTKVYSFKGQLAYINGQAHLARFENDSREYANVILNLEDVSFIDIDGVDTLSEIVELLHNRNKHVIIAVKNQNILQLLLSSKIIQALDKKGLLVSSF